METTNIYEQSLVVMVARIEEKLDVALRTIADHEIRLRGVEKWKSYVIGIAAAVSFLISTAASYLYPFSTKHH